MNYCRQKVAMVLLKASAFFSLLFLIQSLQNIFFPSSRSVNQIKPDHYSFVHSLNIYNLKAIIC